MAEEKEDVLKAIGHWINYVRVATAIAVIKSKPPDISARSHAENLAAKFSKEDVNWKEKALQLESQVLSLKQEIFGSQIRNDTVKCNSKGNDSDFMVEDDPHIYPTPPETQEENFSLSETVAINGHNLFLRNILQLQSLNKEDYSTVLKSDNTELFDICLKTLNETLLVINNWLLSDTTSHVQASSLAKQSVDLIVQLVQRTRFSDWKKFHGVLCDAVVSFIESVTASVFNCSEFYSTDLQQRQEDVLMSFSSIKIIRGKVICMLVSYVEKYSDTLRKVQTEAEILNPFQFENMYIILDLLEQLLKQEVNEISRQSFNKNSSLDFYKEKCTHLENCLMHISQTFPLFSHFVWNINSLITQLIIS